MRFGFGFWFGLGDVWVWVLVCEVWVWVGDAAGPIIEVTRVITLNGWVRFGFGFCLVGWDGRFGFG